MSPKIVVAGAVSLYMAVGVAGFPVGYASTCEPYWIRSGVTGAAGHIAQVLQKLGTNVNLCTVVGTDEAGTLIRSHLNDSGLLGSGVVDGSASSLGVVLVDPDGRRMGLPYLAPVNDVVYPTRVFDRQAEGADLAVLTNARFIRPLVPHVKRLGISIAVDVHLISDIEDMYDRPWMDAAEIVFCSDENLPCGSREWMRSVFTRYPMCDLVCIGQGARGCALGLRDGRFITASAVTPRRIINTSGAGDALFASFLHGWVATRNPIESLARAVLYAGWKIGDHFPGDASLTDQELTALMVSFPVDIQIGTLSDY